MNCPFDFGTQFFLFWLLISAVNSQSRQPVLPGPSNNIPRIVSAPRSQNWRVSNKEQHLSCIAAPKDSVKISWTHDGTELKADGRIAIITGIESNFATSELTFRSVERRDEGLYRCTATNRYGSIQSKVATLVIQGPPTVNKGNPLPISISVSWHEQFSLQCDGAGPPSISKVIWFYKAFKRIDGTDKIVFNSGKRMRLQDTTLRSLPREDDAIEEGVFRYEVQCKVFNSMGDQKSKMTDIFIRQKPGIPALIEVNALDMGQSVNLVWKPGSDGYDSISCYAYFTGGSVHTIKLNSTGIAGRHTDYISGLTPASSYNVYLKCVNSIDSSDPSVTKAFSTTDGIPKKSPTASLEAINSTSFRVSWKPLNSEDIPGKLSGYKVIWGERGKPHKTEIIPVFQTSFAIVRLQPGNTYQASVLAYTVADGPPSKIQSVKLPLFDEVIPPDIQISDVSSSHVMLTVMDRNIKDGAFSNCSVSLNDGIHTIMVSVILTRQPGSRPIENLIPNTSYSVKLGCDSFNGKRMYSEEKIFQTKEGKPTSHPSSLKIQSVNKTLVITWPPVVKDINGILTGYMVCFVARVEDLKDKVCLNSSDTKCVIEHVKPSTFYTVYVSACTSAGCGPSTHGLAKTGEWTVIKPTISPSDITTVSNVLESNAINFVYLTIPILAVCIVIVLIAICCQKRARKSKARMSNIPDVAFSANNREPQYEVPLLTHPGGSDTLNTYYTIPVHQSPPLSKETQMKLEDVKYDCDLVTLNEIIGKGEFGRVYKGIFSMTKKQGGAVKTEIMEVAVKTMIMHEYDPSEYEEFVKEGLRMKDMDHPNVMKLIGICLPSEGNSTFNNSKSLFTPTGLELISPLVVVPYMSNGDLKQYLYRKRIQNETREVGLTMIFQFACDICSGMEYLAEKKIVHRDLACRNCMLDSKMNVVVSDFGLSRQIYSSSYYVQKRAAKMPVKWMAIESLRDRVYTSLTDVWAFGVTAWELFTFCENPFPGVENQEMLELLKAGTRLKRPNGCPNDIWNDAIYPCWDPRPEERPTFSELVEMFKGFKKLYHENGFDADTSDNSFYVNMQPSEEYEKLIESKTRTETVSPESNEIPMPYSEAVERLPSGKLVPKRGKNSSKKPLLQQDIVESDPEDIVDL